MERHLKPEQYYIDLYDRITIEKCRSLEKNYQKAMAEAGWKKDAKITDQIKGTYVAYYYIFYFEAGERYLNKSTHIREWMDADKKRDELLENAQPPDGINCYGCGQRMDVEMKTLDIGIEENEQDRVMFIFRCSNSKCRIGRTFYENGEERISKPDLCEQCGKQLDVKHSKAKDKIISKYTCPGCGHVKIHELDMRPAKKEEPDKHYEHDKTRFCFDQKQGQKYLDMKLNMERMTELMKDIEWRDKNKDIVEKAKQLKKLTLVELEKRLLAVFKKNMYVKFELSKPETIGGVRVEFTIQDAKSGRNEHDSRKHLKKLIDIATADTNWRLMSAGISYRLGILTGQLRGYESEEDLLKLANKKEAKI